MCSFQNSDMILLPLWPQCLRIQKTIHLLLLLFKTKHIRYEMYMINIFKADSGNEALQ